LFFIFLSSLYTSSLVTVNIDRCLNIVYTNRIGIYIRYWQYYFLFV